MTMTQISDRTRCPFCQSTNSCMANSIESCWCNDTKVPQELRDLLPEDQQEKSCICNDCITRFREDKIAFSLKRTK